MWWNLSLNATNQRWWVDPYLNLYECRIWQWETHLTSNFPAVGLAKVQGNVHGNGLAEVCSRPLTTGRRLIWTPLEEFKLDSQPLCVCVSLLSRTGWSINIAQRPGSAKMLAEIIHHGIKLVQLAQVASIVEVFSAFLKWPPHHSLTFLCL